MAEIYHFSCLIMAMQRIGVLLTLPMKDSENAILLQLLKKNRCLV